MQINKMLPWIFLCIITVFGFIACTTGLNTATDKKAPENKNDEKGAGEAAKDDKETAKEDKEKDSDDKDAADALAERRAAPDKSACLRARVNGKKLIADQTFVFDYEPFRGACFVTFANVEDMVDPTDVPRGSTFHIYREGKKIYDFEDAFGGQSACWVEGVGFEDLNNDGETDVIVAGSCLGARDSYPTNAVYANTGDEFRTNESANEEISEFKTIKQISNYVKKNPAKFF